MPALAATQTENYGIPVLPAPGKTVSDGRFDDWDLTGGIFACNNVGANAPCSSVLHDIVARQCFAGDIHETRHS
jgi:hypothetical protein